MVSEDFRAGDLVWAKMKGFPPWPAKIVDPPAEQKAPSKKKKAHFVYFFGSENFAWVLREKIYPHSENALDIMATRKKFGGTYQKGIEDLIRYSRNMKKGKRNFPTNTKEKIPSAKSENSNLVKEKKEVKDDTGKASILTKDAKFSHGASSKQEQNIQRAKKGSPKNLKYTMHSKSRKIPDYVSSDHPHSSDCSAWNDTSRTFIEQYLPASRCNKKHIVPSPKKFGFLGLGHMGDYIVSNLLASGHDITVWNRSTVKCEKHVTNGAKQAHSLVDLVIDCDVIFCCVSDPDASKAVIFDDQGIAEGFDAAEKLGQGGKKGYVELTSLDPETSLLIHDAINKKRGLYLEVPVIGSSKQAQDGELLVLASGDRRLFAECETCFHAFAKYAYYLTCDIGYASKISLLMNVMSGTMCVLLAEALVLAEKLNLDKSQLLKIISHGAFGRKEDIGQRFQSMRGQAIRPLGYIQKDMNLALDVADDFNQPMPVMATVNEVCKLSRFSDPWVMSRRLQSQS